MTHLGQCNFSSSSKDARRIGELCCIVQVSSVIGTKDRRLQHKMVQLHHHCTMPKVLFLLHKSQSLETPGLYNFSLTLFQMIHINVSGCHLRGVSSCTRYISYCMRVGRGASLKMDLANSRFQKYLY